MRWLMKWSMSRSVLSVQKMNKSYGAKSPIFSIASSSFLIFANGLKGPIGEMKDGIS